MTNIVHGEMEPAAGARGNTLWLRLQRGSTNPVGLYWYIEEAKRWLPLAPTSRVKGDIELFVSDPNGVFDLDASKSPTTWGKGLVDGPKVGWALMNGLNGTTAALDRFICFPAFTDPAHMFEGGVWRSKVEGAVLKSQGGESSVTLGPQHTPSHTHDVTDPGHKHTIMQPDDRHDKIELGARLASLINASNEPGRESSIAEQETVRLAQLAELLSSLRPVAAGPFGRLVSSSIYSNTVEKTGVKIAPAVAATAAAAAHNNIPPFLVVCPIQWIGYDSYYSP